jgi:hypothetical protein
MKILIEDTDTDNELHFEIDGTAEELVSGILNGIQGIAETIGVETTQLLVTMQMMVCMQESDMKRFEPGEEISNEKNSNEEKTGNNN